jgi:hypothetical protein
MDVTEKSQERVSCGKTAFEATPRLTTTSAGNRCSRPAALQARGKKLTNETYYEY